MEYMDELIKETYRKMISDIASLDDQTLIEVIGKNDVDIAAIWIRLMKRELESQ